MYFVGIQREKVWQETESNCQREDFSPLAVAVGIPIKPEDEVLLVLQRVIYRSEPDLDFLTPAFDLSGF